MNTVTFGKYRGTPVTALPDVYLRWLRNHRVEAVLAEAAARELDRRFAEVEEPDDMDVVGELCEGFGI